MNNKLTYIFPALFIVAFIALVLIGNLGPSKPCSDKSEFINSTYNAIVINKYLDEKNHNFKTVLYSTNNKLIEIRFIDDTSGYYEFVKPGDSILKSKNTDLLTVNHIKRFRINFDCKQ
ncbi:hypothetical protein [Mucilaginibacter sp.]|uniref:hypothetical protein n=1 Tax=Mucilaginibacter sp. TaxID=1882438 RepID=UPI003D1100F7